VFETPLTPLFIGSGGYSETAARFAGDAGLLFSGWRNKLNVAA